MRIVIVEPKYPFGSPRGYTSNEIFPTECTPSRVPEFGLLEHDIGHCVCKRGRWTEAVLTFHLLALSLSLGIHLNGCHLHSMQISLDYHTKCRTKKKHINSQIGPGHSLMILPADQNCS